MARYAIAVFAIFLLVSGAAQAGSWPRRMGTLQNTNNLGGDSALTRSAVPDLQVVAIFPTEGTLNATPIVSDGLLFIGDWKGFFYVIDVVSGARLIKLDTGSGGQPLSDMPGFQGAVGIQSTAAMALVGVPDGSGGTNSQRRVYFGANQQPKTLYCLNVDAILRDAATLSNDPGTSYFCAGPAGWPISLAAPIGSSPLNATDKPSGAYNGTPLFRAGQPVKNPQTGQIEAHDVLFTPSTGYDCADGQFYAIDAYSGEKYWIFDPVINGDGKGGVIWTVPAMSRDGSHLFLTTGDCVQKPQVGEKAESLVALDPTTGAVQWYHQRRLVDTADFDIGNSPTVVDVDGATGCHDIVSIDKDGCIYGFSQESDIPEIAEPGYDPLRFGQQRVRWRTCLVPGSALGGFDATGASVSDRTVLAQANPVTPLPFDNANAFAVDGCTGQLLWATAAVAKGWNEGAVASGMWFQPSATSLQVLSAGPDLELLATVSLPRGVGAGGGGIAIVDGAIYVPLGSGGVAVVRAIAGSHASAPRDASTTFHGPYPEPLAATGSQVILPLDPTVPAAP